MSAQPVVQNTGEDIIGFANFLPKRVVFKFDPTIAEAIKAVLPEGIVGFLNYPKDEEGNPDKTQAPIGITIRKSTPRNGGNPRFNSFLSV